MGRGSIAGAGAVETKDVPEYSIIGEVPAEIIGSRKGSTSSVDLGAVHDRSAFSKERSSSSC